MSFTGRRRLILALLLATLVVAAYLPGMRAPYHFDSAVWLEAGSFPSGKLPSFAEWFQSVAGSSAGPLRRPVAMASFTLEALLAHGMHPVVSNTVNLALHLLNGWLVFSVVALLLAGIPPREASHRSPTRDQILAATVAAIWLLHPLQSSTVLYAVQRMTQLAATFSLAGMLYYLRHRQQLVSSRLDAGAISRLLCGVFSFTVLATLSKESGILLPWFIVLLELFVHGCRINGRPCVPWLWLCRLAIAMPLILATLAVACFPDTFANWYQGRDFTVGERLLSEARILWIYVSWFVLPTSPAIGFFHDDIVLSRGWLEPWTGAVAVCGWILACATAWSLRNNRPLIALGIAWFLVAHALESSIVPLELAFEHRNYLALVGLALVLAGAMRDLPRALTDRRLALICPAVVMALGILLFVRSGYWGNELQFAARELQNHPDSLRAAYHFGDVSLRAGEAASDPDAQKGHILASRQIFERVLQSRPDSLVAPVTLLYIDGRYFPGLGTQAELAGRIRHALTALKPENSEFNAIRLLVDCLNAEVCRLSQAEVEEIFAIAIGKGFGGRAYTHYQVARYWLGAGGNVSLALGHLQQAARLDPASASVRVAIVQAWAAQGETDRAILAIGEWLQHDPWLVHLATMLDLL